jgi:hypothetical protein
MRLVSFLLGVLALVGVLSLPVVSSDADLGLDSALVIAPDIAPEACIVIERCTPTVTETAELSMIADKAQGLEADATYNYMTTIDGTEFNFNSGRVEDSTKVVRLSSTQPREGYIVNRNTGPTHVEYG